MMFCLGGLLLPQLQAGAQTIGPSTTANPYMLSTAPGVTYTSVLTVGDSIGGYKMCGLADGLGAFDNNDGTFTLVMNHEMVNTVGAVRAHGSMGAFVSKWIINKSTLAVSSGSDLMQSVYLWNPITSSYIGYNSSYPAPAGLTRFCSADLPKVSAFYNSATGKGTRERIFLNGEESGAEGRAFAHIITGTAAGKSYELPYLGKFSWENALASPTESDKTVVIGTDDATPGQVYVYVGTKTNSGNDIEKAGLTNGRVFGVKVSGLTAEVSGSTPAAGTAFSLFNLGSVQNMTGAALNTASNTASVTNFLRPEDGAWDPAHPNDFYFNTTNSFSSPSRVWKLHFTDASNPELGGTITCVLDGTEGQKMLDNMSIDNYGHIILQEDPGGNDYVGKVWEYTIATDSLKQIGMHDTSRFVPGGSRFITNDEESSGVIDMEDILGPGKSLLVVQAHSPLPGQLVEGGQLIAMYNPSTYNSAPEANVTGNSISIVDGDSGPSVGDYTDFGNINIGATATRSFIIQNTGVGTLIVNDINFSGTNASDFSMVTPPAYPATIAPGTSLTITVRFSPGIGGSARSAKINILNNDANEPVYDFALAAQLVTPEIEVTGNSVNIADGDMTAGAANNTDFGYVNMGLSATKTFVINNNGTGALNVSGITITGTNASDFAFTPALTFPLVVPVAGTYTFTTTFTPSAPGTRDAVITLSTDDIDEATFNFAITGNGVSNVGVNTLTNVSSIKVYPNPTSEVVKLQIIAQQPKTINVQVVDLQGNVVITEAPKTVTVGQNTIEINVAALANGVYMIRMSDGVNTTNTRVSVMH